MSASDREAERLPEQAEALLDGWPAPSRSALEWEDLANATVSRIRETSVGSTDDGLLAPPFPKEDGESEVAVNKPAPLSGEPADEPGLLAIAKAAVSANSGDDPKDIARAGLMAAEHSRQSHPPAPPVRAAGQVHRGTPSSAAGLQGNVPKSSARPRVVEAVHAAQARSELPAAGSKGRSEKVSAGAIVAGGMLALAAAVALYVAVHKPRADAVAVATSQEMEKPPAPPAAAAEATAGTTSSPGQEAAGKPQMFALDDLKEDRSAAAEGKVVVPSASSPVSLALRKSETSATAANAAPSKKAAGPAGAAKLLQAVPEQQAVTLNETAEPASGGEKDTQAGSVQKQALPSRPAVGAISGAVGSVMAGARSCLAGQETGSKATVTFGSDGQVKSVSIAGPAAGTPAEGCVRSALMGARVAPFSEPEYSASFTVRPP